MLQTLCESYFYVSYCVTYTLWTLTLCFKLYYINFVEGKVYLYTKHQNHHISWSTVQAVMFLHRHVLLSFKSNHWSPSLPLSSHPFYPLVRQSRNFTDICPLSALYKFNLWSPSLPLCKNIKHALLMLASVSNILNFPGYHNLLQTHSSHTPCMVGLLMITSLKYCLWSYWLWI